MGGGDSAPLAGLAQGGRGVSEGMRTMLTSIPQHTTPHPRRGSYAWSAANLRAAHSTASNGSDGSYASRADFNAERYSPYSAADQAESGESPATAARFEQMITGFEASPDSCSPAKKCATADANFGGSPAPTKAEYASTAPTPSSPPTTFPAPTCTGRPWPSS